MYGLSSQYMCLFLFFTDPAPTEIYTLSLHDALPISMGSGWLAAAASAFRAAACFQATRLPAVTRSVPNSTAGSLVRSEEHTSELQSRLHLVCRLLLEKKKKT